MNGLDITGRPRGWWIIDFEDMPMEQAALYEAPFEYVKRRIYPTRQNNRRLHRKENWWLHGETGAGLRKAVNGLARFIVTPRVSKHRLFAWVPGNTLPDSATIAFARDDDYMFGILHSRPHELWARGMGTQLREVESGFRYTPKTTFETFPFPTVDEDRRAAIAFAAQRLDALRVGWLNPAGVEDEELAKRTLTNLYNAKPTWLTDTHGELDAAALTAYGWPRDLDDESLLSRLMQLNEARSKKDQHRV